MDDGEGGEKAGQMLLQLFLYGLECYDIDTE